jgi:mono/diheme cytochrome c family protein
MSDRWPCLNSFLIPLILVITTLSPAPLAVAGDDAGSGTDAKAQAAAIWESRCAACHGAEGRGDGPGAAALQPKPVNFRNHNWQKAVTNDQIAKAIVEGGSAVGLSNQMPGNPDLEDEDNIVTALVVHVRELGK